MDASPGAAPWTVKQAYSPGRVGSRPANALDSVLRVVHFCRLQPLVHIIESDLIRLHTREGTKVAKAKGRLRGKQPTLNPCQKPIWSASSRPESTAPPSSPTSSASTDGLPCL